ncbi:MAG: small multi-drug export protein [Clostridia bacterium]|nr:small multi-drug export protein [Clostridia bacterium]
MENLIGVIPNEILIMAISMIPVIELRGAIPVGFAMGMEWWKALLLCIIGNIIPVPFIVVYMKPLFNFFRKSRFFVGVIDWLERRTMKKADTVLKYSAIALFAFVAIPLPGTGAWTGAMIAAILGMRLKHAMPAISLGVLTAGVIMCMVSGVIF